MTAQGPARRRFEMVGPALRVALATGLACALWEYSFGGVFVPLYVSSAVAGLLPISVFASTTTFKILAARFILGTPAIRFCHLEDTPLTVGLASIFGAHYLLDSAGIVHPWTFWRLDTGTPMVLLLSVVGVTCYFATQTIVRRHAMAQFAARFTATAPFALATMYLLRWSPQWPGGEFQILSAQAIVIVSFLGVALLLWRHFSTQRATLALAGLLAMFAVGAEAAKRFSASAKATPLISEGASSSRLVLLVSVDTLRRDALLIYNDQGTPTPHLAALAEDSVVFHKAYSAAPWTKPSVFSFLTGTSPWVHGVLKFEDKLPKNLPMLAERLRDAGYRTIGIGHNPWLTDLGSHGDVGDGLLEYDFSPQVNVPHSPAFREAVRSAPGPMRHVSDTDDLTDRAIDALRRTSGEPVFLWLHYFDPHAPFSPPETFRPSGDPAAPYETGFQVHEYDLKSGKLTLNKAQRRWVRQLYEAEIRYVDASIGRLIDELVIQQLYDDALIVFTSDHGEEFWEHGNAHHGHSLYEELIQVPLMIKLPGVDTRSDVNQTVSTVSLVPTILDICGITYSQQEFSDQSLTDLWVGTESERRDRLIFTTGLIYYEQREAVVFDGVKYIEYLESDRIELFDLSNDPGETINQAALHPERTQRGQHLLTEQRLKSAEIRQHYTLDGHNPTDLSNDHLRFLKTLGYL